MEPKGDPVLREKLSHLDAGGSPLEVVENYFGHALSSLVFTGHPSMSFSEREVGGTCVAMG